MQDLSNISKATCNRLVIKIGSALLVHAESGTLRHNWLTSLAKDISKLHAEGIDILIVSSGSIALGREALGLSSRPTKLKEAQAAAAIGQVKLAQAYASIFEGHNIAAAQVLLTLDDLEDRPRYLNARDTLETLIDHRVIPVINENDTVATSEIRFGDNDRLAARVGQIAKADLVVLLSDIDGLYTANPKTNNDAKFIPVVTEITNAIESMAGPAEAISGAVGTGGMVTKIMAAKMATQAGCSLAIAQGTRLHPIQTMIDTGRATLFPASDTPLALRKQWISGMQAPQGIVQIDKGAVDALTRGASLLPVGVTKVDGAFVRGDLVGIMDPLGKVIAQGFVNFTVSDTDKIKGCTSGQISAILGHTGRSTLIHRDDLVIL